jgi:chitinase
VDHWVEEIVRLVRDYRFDGFVLSVDADAPDQIERLGREVAPAVRSALSGSA